MIIWTDLIESQRFRSNAELKLEGRVIDWSELNHSGHIEKINFTFSHDSVRYNFKLESQYYQVSFPNDISLLLRQDLKELKDQLYVNLDSGSDRGILNYPDSVLPEDYYIDAQASRDDILRQQVFRKSTDSSMVCHPEMPIPTLLSSLKDTSYCPGVLLDLITYSYGYRTDTIRSTIPDIIRATNSGSWEKWSAVSGDTLLILLAHPFISFDHMIQIYSQSESEIMLAHFHGYIPRHNIGNRFARYRNKDNQFSIEIK